MNPVVRTLAPIAVLAAGFGLAALSIWTRPTPERTEARPRVARVVVEPIEVGPRPVEVSGTGTVIPARSVDLRSEVAGRVVAAHPALEPGGRLRRGRVAVRLDARDYRVRVTEAKAALQQARFELELEEGRQVVARKEFELLGRDSTELGDASLALREPHLRNARAAVEGAEASLELAQTNLERTRIRVPFNAIVREESVERGLLVDRQTVLARLVGTDSFWVRVSIPVAALEWVRFEDAGGEATPVRVRQDLGQGRSVEKLGRLVRLLSDLDPRGRLARVLVAVDDPLDLKKPPEQREPLLLDAFVEVRMRGRRLEEVATVPRQALRQGDSVWIMAPDDTLEIRSVSPAWKGPQTVYVRGELRAGERLVVSRIPTPVPGMQLRRVPGSSVGTEGESL
ncbi:MAG TPA: efflux RND transporter periplasmic adaptor subunit [Myxococcales bacterium LLY-WYZ-16_1]|nr:efflux RND transporter periplasmic adaptor subunit [Myxococcales bacterium LLY-WYZ-16_1]